MLLHDLFPAQRLLRDEARIRSFWAGEGRCLVSCTSQTNSYRQLGSLAAMQAAIPVDLADQARLPGVNLPTIHADFGTVSTARYWGGRLVHGAEGNPHLEPAAASPARALDLQPAPVLDPEQDVARALALFAAARHELADPGALWLRTPDMQGTLNTAALVCEQTAFMVAMHEEPDRVHALLERICSFLIDYQEALRAGAPGRIAGNIWPWTVLPPDLGISLTEDYMPLLGVPQYRDFGLPHLARLARRFGGVQIHCCGRWGRHVPTLLEGGFPIRAVEFHHPFTTLEEVLPLAEAGAVLVPFFNDREQPGASPWPYYDRLLTQAPASARFWFAVGDDPPAQDFARRLQLGAPASAGLP